jgi:hypothetical protein
MISVRISYIFSFMVMHSKHILRPLLITALFLMLPAAAELLLEEMEWGPEDFAVIGVLVFATALAYELIAKKSNNMAYRLAVGMGVLTALGLYWVNLAVGLIGNETNDANMLYFLVPFVGLIGAFIARFRPQGMAYAMFATAIAQMLVPVIALAIFRPEFDTPGAFLGLVQVIGVTAFFAVPWVVSGFQFLLAAREPHENNPVITPVIGWLFGLGVAAIGAVNIFWGNDMGFGILILLLSLAYFLPVHALLKGKVSMPVVTAGKVALGILILWMALGVGELFDKIDLMLANLR